MSQDQKPTSLEQLLDRIRTAADENNPVSVGDVMNVIGRRSFGPVLLLAGLVTLAPVIGGIPGVPVFMGVVVFLIAVQMLFGRAYFWLPRWLLDRSLANDKVSKAVEWLRRPARFVDRLLEPRLLQFTQTTAVYGIAVTCILIAAGLPAMELVPFSATLAGAALAAFGLALIAHDGLLALIAFAFTGVTAGVVVYGLM